MTSILDDKLRAKMTKRIGCNPDHFVEMFAEARASFDQFAGMDAPLLPARPSEALQVRLVRWQAHNFGTPKPVEIACGIAEEAGERVLANVMLSVADARDAIGDTMVYLSQLATARRLAMSTILDTLTHGPWTFNGHAAPARDVISIAVGYLSHVQLKDAQSIRGMDGEVTRFATFVGASMLVRGLDGVSDRSLYETWLAVSEDVLKRDWKADPVTGGAAS